MQLLKTNTAVRICVGPFLDATDGVTPEIALTVTNCQLTMLHDDDDGTAVNLVLDAAATASGGSNDMVHVTSDAAGYYDLELTAANTNRLGRVKLAITDAANHCPVFHEFMIVPANIYDSWVLGTDVFDVSVTQWRGTSCPVPATAGVPTVDTAYIAGTAQDATDLADFAAEGYDPATNKVQGVVLTDTTTTLTGHTAQTGDSFARIGATGSGLTTLSTQASVDTIDANVDTLLTRITSTLFSGITSLAEWLGLIAGKQAGDATALTEIKGTGAGSGTYDPTTDSTEAIRDHVGDGTNLTEAGGTGDHLTAIDLPNQTMDITGNLSGSVGSVTGAVGSVTGHTAQTGDSFARIGAAGAALTDLGGMSTSMKAEVNAECDTALSDLNLDSLVILSGTATGGSTTTVVDTARTEADTDFWRDTNIHMTSGLAANQTRKVVGFTPGTDTITVEPAFTQAVANTDTYVILHGESRSELRTATQTSVDAIEADTNELQTDDVPGLIATAQADLDTITGADGVNLLSATQTSIDAIEADTNELQTDDVPTLIAAVQSDTDDIQTRLPAALSGAGNMKSDVLEINSVAAAAVRLAISADLMVPGTVDTAGFTPTTTEFEADDITEATASHYVGRSVLFSSNALDEQATNITAYTLTGGRGHFTVDEMTEAPANNDTFLIV